MFENDEQFYEDSKPKYSKIDCDDWSLILIVIKLNDYPKHLSNMSKWFFSLNLQNNY